MTKDHYGTPTEPGKNPWKDGQPGVPRSGLTSDRVSEFLNKAKPSPTAPRSGRVIFALDATASRKPTWDAAMTVQAQMFESTASLGTLSISLVYYRGHDECRASRWTTNARELMRYMTSIECRAGSTQVKRMLQRALSETEREHVNAVIFVGDCFEESHHKDHCYALATSLREHETPVFIFQEGSNPYATEAFTQIAKLSDGSVCPFNSNSPETLRVLLEAVATLAVGGRQALSHEQREILKLEHKP